MRSSFFSEKLGRLTFSGDPPKDVLLSALSLLEDALGTREVYLVHGAAEGFDYVSRTTELALTPTALWVIHQELTNGGTDLGFRRRGNRVIEFGRSTKRKNIEFVASLITPRGASHQMVLARGPWPNGLSATQQQLLVACLPALSILTDRWLGQERAARDRAELGVFAHVSELVAQSSDLEATLTSFAKIVGDVVDLDYVTIDALDADRRVALRCINYTVPADWKDRWKAGKDNPDPVREHIIKTRQPIIFSDAQHDERIPEAGRRYFTRSLIRSTAVFPLVANDEVVGLLALASNRSTDFGGRQREVIDTLTQQVAVAIRGIQLYDELRDSRNQLLDSERRFRSLVQNASDLITVIDADTRILYQSPSVENVLGRSADEFQGAQLIEFVHPEDCQALETFIQNAMSHEGQTFRAEVRMRASDGAWHDCDIVGIDRRHDASVGGFVLNIRDVSERRAFEDQLRHQALHDALTGLANRTCIQDRLEVALRRATRSAKRVEVLFIDLDNFKAVNDGLGHAAGDSVLSTVASRLLDCIRSGDTAARLGGDEFAVLMEDISGESDAEASAVADRVLAAMRQPFFAEGHELYLGASIGLADSADGGSADELLQQADAAMYAAKSRGKNRVERYEPTLLSAVGERLQLLAELQYAVQRDEIVLHYQPMVDLQTGATVGLEALARWQHPRRGLVQPNEFIPLAEESGLIVDIGRYVLREACRQVRAWDTQYAEHGLVLSVNVSPRQLQDTRFVADVASILAATAFPPEKLVLEITENVMMQDPVFARSVFEEIHALGVRFAVDDFGTGYSSLGYLRQLPFDILKIDKSFVDIPEGGEKRELARAIVDLARTLQLSIVAEGIELPEQVSKLQLLHCDVGQGFFFSKPLAPADVEAWLKLIARQRDEAA